MRQHLSENQAISQQVDQQLGTKLFWCWGIEWCARLKYFLTNAWVFVYQWYLMFSSINGLERI